MEQKSKILYVCQQVDPYIAETPRSLRSKSLLQGMHDLGYEIRTFMPRYGTINERRNQLHEVIRLSGMNIIIGDTDHQLIIKVASIPSARIQIYLIDNDDYFARKAIMTDESGAEFKDNDERAIFFARGVLETVKKLRWEPAVVHCHGWLSALVAAYLRHSFADDPIFAGIKVVISLDSDVFETPLAADFADKLRGEKIDGAEVDLITEATYENYCRFVISYADGIVISDESVDESIQEIARQSGKPLLEYQDPQSADYYENYAKFYEEL